MMIFGAFKVRKPRGYDYKPRYYNPEQEAREERKREVLARNMAEKGLSCEESEGAGHSEGGRKEYQPGQYIGEMRMRRGISSARKFERRKMNLTRVIIFVVLMLIAVWYLLK